MQKHAGRSSIDRKTAPYLSDPRYLLKCDALSCEEVVKTVPTSPRRNKELRPMTDFSPSMLLYGALSLFRTNFPRCHALLSFVTSSLASPIVSEVGLHDFFYAATSQSSNCRISIISQIKTLLQVVFFAMLVLYSKIWKCRNLKVDQKWL